MRTASLLLLALLAGGGERERGLQLYREGRFAEAAAAFRAAIEQDGDSPELQWNLALASWRAGDLAAAETAAEKYAAASRDARADLHAGLLGAVRHDEAKALEAQADAAAAAAPGAEPPADPLPLLEQALAKAQRARDHFVRGAAARATPELLRNAERSLRTIDALQRRIDELKKQREQQQEEKPEEQKQEDEKKPDEKKPDEEKPDEKKPGEQKQPDEQKKPEEEQKPTEKKPEQGEPEGQPKPSDPQEPPEPKPGEQPNDPKRDAKPQPAPSGQPQDQPQPAEAPRNDAPGEGAAGRELTPEQTARLLEQLRALDDKHRAIRARLQGGRKPVERDW